MQLNRRTFLTSTALVASSAALAVPSGKAAEPKKNRIKLGISTYSYWHFRPPKASIETVIERSADIGVGGVDILHRQMDIEEKAAFNAAGHAYCNKLKRIPFPNGIDLIC